MSELENQNFDGEKKITEEVKSSEDIRLYIADLIKDKDKLSSEVWDQIFRTPENAKAYLEKNELLNQNWINSGWLSANGYSAFYKQAIQRTTKERPESRFKSWDDFLIWMGEEVEAKINWDEVFKSPASVKEYLEENGILDKNWSISIWLKANGSCAFYKQAIQSITKERPNPRFRSWEAFLIWMGEKNEEDAKEKINGEEVFKSPENVRQYLKDNELIDKKWQSSEWLRTNGYRAFYHQAIKSITKERPKPRFRSWEAFLIWMGEKNDEDVKEKINWDEVFNSPEHVREYLGKNESLNQNWRIPSWLNANGYGGFYQQVRRVITKERTRARFKSWEAFLIWMGEEIEEKTNWDEIFKSPENVKKYLEKNDLLDKNWKRPSWIINNGYNIFYIQVFQTRTKERPNPRFTSWEAFLIWMGEEVEEKTNWDEVFKSRASVKEYLEENGILDKSWQSSSWLCENGHGAFYQQAVRRTTKENPNPRFNSWNDFLEWMGEEVEGVEKTNWDEVFRSPENVKEYLEKNDLLDKNWRSTSWLSAKGYGVFYKQTVRETTKERPNPRFRSWEEFLIWMGEKNEEDVKEKINWDELFKSAENVRAYLEVNKILDKKWQSSEWLQKNNYGSFYSQAVITVTKERPISRFKSWEEFLIWMGERESRNEENYQISEDIINKIREGIEDEF